MRTVLLWVPLAFLLASCGDPQVGLRYRAERDLWQADWEQKNLSIRPDQTGRRAWQDLAARYEGIASRYGDRTRGDPEVRTLAARALFSAIGIHGSLGDSAQVEGLYGRMAEAFDDIPVVAGEVALARGRIAERRGEAGAAADCYQTVVDRIAPRSGARGLAAAVLDLPLRIAQLRSRGAPGGVAREAYAAAQTYYEQRAGDAVSDTVQCDSRFHLAQIAADLREWDQAVQILRTLEADLRAATAPARSPCEVRFAIAGLQSRTGGDPEEARATLTSLLQDYPDCRYAAGALLVLANNAKERGRVDEALEYLDRVVQEHSDDADAAPEALLARARLLELNHRWPEALDAYRGVSVQFPISSAALQAPLEIALHYSRTGEADAMATALQQAERDYRSLIARYPAKSFGYAARQRLVQTLALQQKYDAAIAELMGMGDELEGTSQGATALVAAARMAFSDMRDTTRAITILERAGETYANAEVGRWAAGEARRLKESKVQ